MELWQLEVFTAVAEEKSFSRAGHRLGRTQPAISSAIKLLEVELGEPLFDRMGKTIRLTGAGEVIDRLRKATAQAQGRSDASRSANCAASVEARCDWARMKRPACTFSLKCLQRSSRLIPRFRLIFTARSLARSPNESSRARWISGSSPCPIKNSRLEVSTIHSDEMALIVSPHTHWHHGVRLR